MAIKFIDESEVTVASIRTPAAQVALLQPDPLHPITDAFKSGQSDYWLPPQTAWQLEINSGSASAFGIVYGGSIEGDVSWQRNIGTADQQELDTSGGVAALFLDASDSASFVRITVSTASRVRVYRLALGTRRDISAAISPQSVPPIHGLNIDWHSSQIKSDRNVFLGRQGGSAGEVGRLHLTHIPQDDHAFGFRRRLIDGDVIAELPNSGVFNGETFYSWSDGKLPEPVLGNSLRWTMDLPLRYWSAR